MISHNPIDSRITSDNFMSLCIIVDLCYQHSLGSMSATSILISYMCVHVGMIVDLHALAPELPGPFTLGVASPCACLWHPARMSKQEGADAPAPRTRVPAKTAAAKAAAPKAAPAAVAPEPASDEARPVLEMDGAERNALLSSLRAQTSAKKATQEHRDEAQRLLDSYKNGNAKDKVELLLSLREKGVKNLNWTHQFKEKVTHDSTTECASTGGMFTKSKIFQINGLVERDMTDEEAAETLEDLLTEAETLYGYPRQHVAHKTNRRLDRWYYKWAEGETSREVFGS